MLGAVEADSKQGNEMPVSEEGIREKGLREFGGGSGHFWLGGGKRALRQGGGCTQLPEGLEEE